MNKFKIGVLIGLNRHTDLAAEIAKTRALGLDCCQLCVWDTSLFLDCDFAEYVRSTVSSAEFRVSALWSGWSGPCEWNFTSGPATIGLVPAAYRDMRLEELHRASDFAEKIGVNMVATHVGFIPEYPSHPDYSGIVSALHRLCGYMKQKGQYFLFETGQETPVTMLRTIEAIGCDNVGINFDTANLILYGKANTLDALDVFGKYVMDTHIKDGFYPIDGMSLGREVPAGEGKANIPAVIRRLSELGYSGSLTIEREISGAEQIRDICRARDLILSIMEN